MNPSSETVWVTGASLLLPVVGSGCQVARLAGMEPFELLGPERTRRLDPLSQRCLCAAEQALIAAQMPRGSFSVRSGRDGVAVGSALGATVTSVRYAKRLVTAGTHVTNPIDFPDSIDGAMAAHLALDWGLTGPNLTFVSGRQSAGTALTHAARLILRGRADRMLVVAGDYFDPLFVDALAEEGAVSGTQWAEALLAFVLERPGQRVPPAGTVLLLGCMSGASAHDEISSLGLVDPSGVLELAEAWRAVTEPGGTRESVVSGHCPYPLKFARMDGPQLRSSDDAITPH